MDALKVSNLTKHYKDFTLNEITFSLPIGSVMGFIGENGAGKSTIINAILGLISPDKGEIQVLGETMKGELSQTTKQKLGVVLGEDSFPLMMKVSQVGKMLAMSYENWDNDCFERYLKRFGLPSEKTIKQYSRGMKMKLALAAALSHKAQLLILDEATSGLDPVVRDEILDILFEFVQDEKCSVLLSSHITSDLEKICDYITFIHNGNLLYSEEKDALLERMCIVKCGKEQLKELDSTHIRGVRNGTFGTEVLMERKDVPQGFVTDSANLEDMIVFLRKRRNLQ